MHDGVYILIVRHLIISERMWQGYCQRTYDMVIWKCKDDTNASSAIIHRMTTWRRIELGCRYDVYAEADTASSLVCVEIVIIRSIIAPRRLHAVSKFRYKWDDSDIVIKLFRLHY